MNRSAEEIDSALDEEAADWCMRIAEATLEGAARSEFDHWMAEARNRKAFEEAVFVWRGVEVAAGQPEILQLRSRVLESLRRANGRRWAARIPARWGWLSVVAAAVAIVTLGVFFDMHKGVQTFETGVAERRIIRLDDGSQLSLDASSRVDVRFTVNRRDLRLIAGRARFDVAKNPLRPFSVAVDDKVVVAVGTSFSVELVQRQMRVVLYEGRVEVLPGSSGPATAAAPGRVLTAGHELWSPLGRSDAAVMAADIPRAASWESGQLNFANEPLATAVEQMNRYSQKKLVVADAAAAAINVNGVFNEGDIDAFIEGLKSFFPIKVTEDSGRILIAGNRQGKK